MSGDERPRHPKSKVGASVVMGGRAAGGGSKVPGEVAEGSTADDVTVASGHCPSRDISRRIRVALVVAVLASVNPASYLAYLFEVGRSAARLQYLRRHRATGTA